MSANIIKFSFFSIFVKTAVMEDQMQITFVTFMLLLFPSPARGQYRDTTETSMMSYRKGHLEMQGSRLSNEEVRILVGDDYAKYCRGRKQRTAGCILTPIGACTLGASIYLSYVGLITTVFGKPAPLYAGIALNVAGGGILASGIATLCGSRSNLRQIASGYNSGKTGTKVSFSPAENGIGIAVRF